MPPDQFTTHSLTSSIQISEAAAAAKEPYSTHFRHPTLWLLPRPHFFQKLVYSLFSLSSHLHLSIVWSCLLHRLFFSCSPDKLSSFSLTVDFIFLCYFLFPNPYVFPLTALASILSLSGYMLTNRLVNRQNV